jgi:transcription antitermination protein NusB
VSKKRTKAREFALQAVYQWQLSGNAIHDIVNQFAIEKKPNTYEVEYFKELLEGVAKSLDELDEKLSPLVDRKIEQIDPVERAILRIAAFELMHHYEIPYRVIINEAVELAKKFGADQGHKYVNGVVDKLSRSVRQLEFNAHQKTS